MTAGTKKVAGTSCLRSSSMMRGTERRAPYSPWESLPGERSLSRSGIDS